jgi:hypothetical protein
MDKGGDKIGDVHALSEDDNITVALGDIPIQNIPRRCLIVEREFPSGRTGTPCT